MHACVPKILFGFMVGIHRLSYCCCFFAFAMFIITIFGMFFWCSKFIISNISSPQVPIHTITVIQEEMDKLETPEREDQVLSLPHTHYNPAHTCLQSANALFVR